MQTATPIPKTIKIKHPLYSITALIRRLTGTSRENAGNLGISGITKKNMETKRSVFCAPFPCGDQNAAPADSDIFLSFMAEMLEESEFFQDHFVDDLTLIVDSNLITVDEKEVYLAFGAKQTEEGLVPTLQFIPKNPPVNFYKHRCVYVNLV